MSLWREIFDPAVQDDEAALRHQPVPEGKVRIHVFAGDFATEEESLAYCFDAPDPAHPEPLTRDLSEATIDTAYVDTAYGAEVVPALATFFEGDVLAKLTKKISGHNTVVLISEYAFRGLPYALSDTPVLRYLGPFVVAAK